MAKFAPHYNLFKIIDNLILFGKIAFWLIIIFSIVPVAFKDFCNIHNLINTINILNIIGIGLFFIIGIINEYILTPQADSKRRDDFIDNSFGSAFSTNSSVDYYDNDEVSKGLYKAAVNLFENCFFSYSLVKATTLRQVIIPSGMLLLMVVLSYYGLKEVPYTLSVLQAIFSANILGQLIKHLILLNKLSTIQDSWIALFQHGDLKTTTLKYQTSIYRYWLQYETLQSKIKAEIPGNIFNKLNPLLTSEWIKMKIKYNIS
ncbi:MAG: hypothetical protein M3Q58_11595 [Bacteroidota bacterium]|nr:hypothetical protein [Bacteroidota bacterium]